MRVLERGGAAAASMIERLREAQRRIEPLEVSPDSLWLCREHEVLAPLLEFSDVDAALRPTVEALEVAPVPLPEDEMRTRARGLGFLSEWPVGVVAKPVTATASELKKRAARILAETEPDTLQFARSGSTAAKSPRREWLVPARERVEFQSPVDREDAAHRLESVFAGDERLLRAWDQVVAGIPARPEVDAILGEPESQRMGRMDTPPDPIPDLISLRLQPVVDRAWRKRSTRTTVELPGSRMLRPDSTASETPPPHWDPLTNREETGRPFGEPPRTSGLRRLASYGETIEPERVLSMPSPSPAAPKETPQQQPSVAFERADLAHEVAEIFRREALRHGIVSEEDIP